MGVGLRRSFEVEPEEECTDRSKCRFLRGFGEGFVGVLGTVWVMRNVVMARITKRWVVSGNLGCWNLHLPSGSVS